MHTNLKRTRSQVLVFAFVGLALATGGFVMGWHLSRRPIGPGYPTHYLIQKGDAQKQVRAAVLVSLRAFDRAMSKETQRCFPHLWSNCFQKIRTSWCWALTQGNGLRVTNEWGTLLETIGGTGVTSGLM